MIYFEGFEKIIGEDELINDYEFAFHLRVPTILEEVRTKMDKIHLLYSGSL
jgi:hypothetical protein